MARKKTKIKRKPRIDPQLAKLIATKPEISLILYGVKDLEIRLDMKQRTVWKHCNTGMLGQRVSPNGPYIASEEQVLWFLANKRGSGKPPVNSKLKVKAKRKKRTKVKKK